MVRYFYHFSIVWIFLAGCYSTKTSGTKGNYKSETLEIQKISDHTYRHISFFNSEDFGKVPCNGMIVADRNEAVIFDTPTGSAVSLELIRWIETELECEIKAVIPTHFHADCLGGLDAFHQRRIPSYAHLPTIGLARSRGMSSVPQNGFDRLFEFIVGRKKVIVEFFGEGHTRDNVIGYVPDEKILFGGCLIKETGAGKGNLEDANVMAWSQTVKNIKDTYQDTKVIIPGHGQPGGMELLDYTITLFEEQ